MYLLRRFFERHKGINYGVYTRTEFLAIFIDYISYKMFHNMGLPTTKFLSRVQKRKFPIKNGICYVKDVKLPETDSMVDYDIFASYLYMNDDYSEETVDKLDLILGEGVYGLVNDKVNVTVEPGDIVIDAGSWIGDFAAYASVRGGTTYAFEPMSKAFNYVEQTARLNKNIIPVKKGLSDKNQVTEIFMSGSGSTLLKKRAVKFSKTESVETVRLDDFVHENNLSRVDFIKDDIEGFERHMLAGAQGVLREFAPKLALCTYHLPDDPEVMADLIKQANPKYNIVQKRKKLFASVPK